MAPQCHALWNRVQKAEEALEFYADPFNHKDENGDDIAVPDFYDELDFGDVAKNALSANVVLLVDNN